MIRNNFHHIQQISQLSHNSSLTGMSNMHGINQQVNQRRVQLNSYSGSSDSHYLSMLGIRQSDIRLMGSQIVNNRIPFINIMYDDIPAIQESIPYTLKLVLCPSIKLLSFSTLVLLVIWIMYIVCLTEGIDQRHYQVLAPRVQTLRKFGAFNYQLLKDGDVWRLITAVFLHENLGQIVMNSILILFIVTQLQQCYNPFLIGVVMIVSAVTSNITVAVFSDMYTLHAGAGPMIYGVLGGFFGYLVINWQCLFLIRSQLCCIICIITFFAMLFSIGGIFGFAGFSGGMFGGFCCSLGIIPGIKPKGWIIIGAGGAGIAVYWVMMFLIFYLAV